MTCIGQEVGRAHYLYTILSGLAKGGNRSRVVGFWQDLFRESRAAVEQAACQG